MNIVLRILLCGIYDQDSILFALSEAPHIVKVIWLMIKELYISHIKLPLNYRDVALYNRKVARRLGNCVLNDNTFFMKIPKIRNQSAGLCNKDLNVSFPPPTDIEINMMPYIYGGGNFKSYKLPSYLKSYFKIIKQCYFSSEDINNVFYFTIHESWVEPGKIQRCPGVHIDNFRLLKMENDRFKENYMEGEGVGSLIVFIPNLVY